MEQIEQAVELYDFLYKDSGRLTSYYSQIFKGRLTSLEQTDSDKETVDRSGKLNLQVVGGDIKIAEEIQNLSKRTIDPHELLTTDVLSYLQSNELVSSSVDDAPHGSLVIAQGTLIFVDRHTLELAVTAYGAIVAEEQKKPPKQRDNAAIQTFKLIKDFLNKVSLPSAFLLQTEAGLQIAGTIKEIGLEETISSYYFKHGTAGLSGVYLVGIKEVPSLGFSIPNTQLMGIGQQLAQSLSDMLFPPEAIRVTPIVLFRKL